MDNVGIKASREEYDFSVWSSDKDGKVERYKEIAEWFTDEFYAKDQKFRKRNDDRSFDD